MRLVIDASVAVKWLVVEDRSDLARDVLREGFVLLAPDLLLTEVANALRNKVRANQMTYLQAKAGLELLPDYFDEVLTPGDTLAAAFELACLLNHPVADCVYVACATRSQALLLTDDARLHQKATTLGGSLQSTLLINWTPGLPV